jgi:DNA-directed RNA polymerase specialized sigma24 family protein
MDDSLKGSVSGWLDELKAGGQGAAQELWNRYFAQLVHLARGRLHGLNRDADEEDVMLSALKSALIGVQNNRFPDLHDRTGLWPLLVTITARKAQNETKRQHAQKRDRHAELAGVEMQLIAGHEPPPDFGPRLVEAIQSLVSALDDESLRLIALRKLEGFTNDDIARELGVATRTVVRKLTRIRQEWEEARNFQ